MDSIPFGREVSLLICLGVCIFVMMNRIIFDIRQISEPIASSYELLKQWIHETGVPSGTVVNAAYQTAGRGQGSNSWYSSPGKNLLPSLYMELTLPVERLWAISEAIALAVYETVHEIVGSRHQCYIKWPNDIIVDDRKISGILIHNELMGQGDVHTIVGIGLDVNEQTFPDELASLATSLSIVTGLQYNLEEVLNRMLRHIAYQIELAQSAQHHQLHERYNSLLYRKDRTALYRDVASETIFSGIIREVNAQGRLIISEVGGSERQYAHKEIAYL